STPVTKATTRCATSSRTPARPSAPPPRRRARHEEDAHARIAFRGDGHCARGGRAAATGSRASRVLRRVRCGAAGHAARHDHADGMDQSAHVDAHRGRERGRHEDRLDDRGRHAEHAAAPRLHARQREARHGDHGGRLPRKERGESRERPRPDPARRLAAVHGLARHGGAGRRRRGGRTVGAPVAFAGHHSGSLRTTTMNGSGAGLLRRLIARPSIPGLCIGTLFFAASLTPSLVPREFYVQGALAGVAIATGYALGVLGVSIWRYLELPLLRGRAKQIAALAAGIACAAVALFCLSRAAEWQNSIRALMELPPVDSAHPYLVVAIALPLAAVLVLL